MLVLFVPIPFSPIAEIHEMSIKYIFALTCLSVSDPNKARLESAQSYFFGFCIAKDSDNDEETALANIYRKAQCN